MRLIKLDSIFRTQIAEPMRSRGRIDDLGEQQRVGRGVGGVDFDGVKKRLIKADIMSNQPGAIEQRSELRLDFFEVGCVRQHLRRDARDPLDAKGRHPLRADQRTPTFDDLFGRAAHDPDLDDLVGARVEAGQFQINGCEDFATHRPGPSNRPRLANRTVVRARLERPELANVESLVADRCAVVQELHGLLAAGQRLREDGSVATDT